MRLDRELRECPRELLDQRAISAAVSVVFFVAGCSGRKGGLVFNAFPYGYDVKWAEPVEPQP